MWPSPSATRSAASRHGWWRWRSTVSSSDFARCALSASGLRPPTRRARVDRRASLRRTSSHHQAVTLRPTRTGLAPQRTSVHLCFAPAAMHPAPGAPSAPGAHGAPGSTLPHASISKPMTSTSASPTAARNCLWREHVRPGPERDLCGLMLLADLDRSDTFQAPSQRHLHRGGAGWSGDAAHVRAHDANPV
jgi:hypothetical protein